MSASPLDPAAIPLRKVRSFLEMVKFSHTIFALPFAIAGLLMGARGVPSWETLGWVVAAMVGARTAAMAFNRLVDARFDAINPRTSGRALPAGVLSRPWVVASIILSSALFAFAAWSLNELCFLLAGPTLVVLFGYSLTKRFTSLSHFALGIALGISPLGAYLAVTGEFDAGWVSAGVLGGVVVLWVAGFDIIYACQDVEVDRSLGLHSLPATLGLDRALRIARALHVIMLGLLIWLGVHAGFGVYYFGAVGIIAVLLVVEHRLVRPDDLGRVNIAFFNINATISILVLAGIALEILAPGALRYWWDEWVPHSDTPDPLILIGIMLFVGHLLGEAVTHIKIPRITGYLAAGVLLGPYGLEFLFDPTDPEFIPRFLQPGEMVAEIALGLIVFTVGLQVDLWELVVNPRPFVLAAVESLLAGILVTIGLVYFVGWSLPVSAVAGAIAMSSSPAVVILVRRELNADGPMVRRILATVGFNNLLSFVVFSLAVPFLAKEQTGESARAWVFHLYRLLGSAGVGVLLGALLGWLEGAMGKDLGIFLLRGGVVLAGIGIGENLGLSPLLLLLVTGVAAECFARYKGRELLVDFGRVEVAFFIVLFVV
ncbi:MAG: UbiA-like polyprenyltransferase, partial [Planctomycetota bacterium]